MQLFNEFLGCQSRGMLPGKDRRNDESPYKTCRFLTFLIIARALRADIRAPCKRARAYTRGGDRGNGNGNRKDQRGDTIRMRTV